MVPSEYWCIEPLSALLRVASFSFHEVRSYSVSGTAQRLSEVNTGNSYEIENIGPVDARLVFLQSREIKVTEEVERLSAQPDE